MYILAEYIGWVEILRREIRFLDVGNVKANRRLAELMENITEILYQGRPEVIFRLLRGEQRAIGEIMIASTAQNHSVSLECIGYATFIQRLRDPDFNGWFQGLSKDLEKFLTDSDVDKSRIVLLQNALIDLIDFLDADCIRIPKNKRNKVILGNPAVTTKVQKDGVR